MLLYITISTLILALILLGNNFQKNKNAVFISCFFIFASIYSITHYFYVFGKSPFWLAIFFNNFTPLYLLLGPLLLFYIRGTINDNSKLSKIDALHFFPAIIQLIGIVPYLFLPFEEKLHVAQRLLTDEDALLKIRFNIFFMPSTGFLIRAILLFIYEFYCIYLLLIRTPINSIGKVIPKKQFLLTYKWLFILLINLIIITFCFFLITVESIRTSPANILTNYKILFSIIGVCFFIMTFSLLLFPNILYGMPRKILIASTSNSKKNKTENEPSITEEEFIAEEDPFFELSEKIKEYLIKDKPYLNPEFSISTIALEMQVPQNHISYCINTIMDTKFYTLRTNLRIEYSLELLQNNVNDILTIEAIGEKSGFKTRSNFYAAFKEKTGLTPTEFIDSKKNNE
jgi:AraC-like DNA-binding protein